MDSLPAQNGPTQSLLRETFAYDEATGVFRWKICNPRPEKVGTIAGNITAHGYWQIGLGGKRYSAHRLAWIYVNGEIPEGLDIDHADGCRANNAISNLRPATRSQNNQNGRSRRSLKGAHLNSKGGAKNPWRAQIRIDGRTIRLGQYKTAEEAHQAYMLAARLYYREWAREA